MARCGIKPRNDPELSMTKTLAVVSPQPRRYWLVLVLLLACIGLWLAALVPPGVSGAHPSDADALTRHNLPRESFGSGG
jgi:hypothetical protein